MVRFELRRKVLHVVTAVAAVPVLLVVPFPLALALGAVGILAVTLTWGIERRRLPPSLKGPLHDEFAEVLAKTRRPHEDYPWSPVLYTASLMIVATAYHLGRLPLSVVFAAYAILGLGDAASALVGVAYGRRKLPWNRKKSLEGTTAGAAAGLMAGALFGAVPFIVKGLAVPPLYIVVVGAGALAGALAETLPRVEDNFVVPLVASGVMAGAAAAMGVGMA
jgi:dolichol kinase